MKISPQQRLRNLNEQEHTRFISYLEEENWYACLTLPRGEKIADKGLDKLKFDHYLPLIRKKQKWSDRIREVDFPLFSGYIFVRGILGSSHEKKRLLQAPKIAHIMARHGIPLAIPDSVVRSIRIIVAEWDEKSQLIGPEFTEELKAGDAIEVVDGSLKGVRGVYLSSKNEPRVAVYIEAIGQGVAVEIDRTAIRKLSSE